MMMWIALLLGAGIGVGARHAYGDSARQVEREKARVEKDELSVEIYRLRAQVALHINEEQPRPQYQCYKPGCPAKHESKRQICWNV